MAFFGKGYAWLSFTASLICSVKPVCVDLFNLFLKVVCSSSNVHQLLHDLPLAIVLVR